MYSEISNPMDYRVALYIRLSKEDDREAESQSVTNQRSMLLDFTQKNRLSVHDTYIDDGFSGTSFDRPAFNRLIEDIEAKKVNMVITKDMSRLGRDYIQTGHYLECYFPENRVRYISILDGIDTGIDSTMNDITPFKAIMNDMYAKDISKKIKSVKHDKQRKGLFIGGKAPYGYILSKTEKNTLLIDDDAAAIVCRMFQMAVDGKSCREIAITLNNEGIPPPAVYANLPTSRKGPYSGTWSAERVTDMLKNQMYIGNMVQGKMKKISYKSKKCLRTPREDWIIVEDTHPPLIEKEVFDKVQLLIHSRLHTRSRTHDYLLKGLLYCHECGYPLGVINRKLSGGVEALYTVCRTYQRFTNARRCTCHCIRLDHVNAAVLERVTALCKAFINRDNLEAAAKAALADYNAHNNDEQELEQLQNRIAKLTADLDKIYADKLSGLLEEDDFGRMYRRLKEDRTLLQSKADILAKRFQADAPAPSLELDALTQRFLKSVAGNRELLVSLVERVEMSEAKELFIYFRFRKLENMQRFL